ncbi:MAG: hypothetical protein R3E95_03030 [Thiolinea sp.]
MHALKRLDQKLAQIRSGQYQPSDFIIADAKDGDMAFGITAPGLGRRPIPERAALISPCAFTVTTWKK